MADHNPLLCANGCGFYGSSKTNNLCSKCEKDCLKQLMLLCDNKSEVVTTGKDNLSVDSSSLSSPSTKPKNHRCESCNKKVGLLGFSCRCGKVLCDLHRYPEEHSCNFDHKTADRLILAKQNPVLNVDKHGARI